ncbi:MAG: N-acetylneuraminate synthase family protein [Geminicoccaceae bacterium]
MEFVAEFTTNHMGNLNILLRMVEAASWAGADIIKMQKKDVETFYSQEKLSSFYESPYGKTYRDYRSIFEFDHEDYRRFDAKCEAENIAWFSTIQDEPSYDFMAAYNLPIYKVASINARNHDFLRATAERISPEKRIVISVAGSELRQIEQAIELFPNHQINILHCVAQYPCPLDQLRLGNIPVLKRQFGDERIKIGYSGHEMGIEPSLAAIALGAEMVERHFALSRHSFVHHIECSLEPGEFQKMVAVAKSISDLTPYIEKLPREALQSSFGMSTTEKDFLVDHQYGRKYLHDKSTFDT